MSLSKRFKRGDGGQFNLLRFFQSLNGKLLVFFVLIALIPMAVLTVVITENSRAALQNSIQENMHSQAGLIASQIDEYIEQRKTEMVILANTDRVRSMDPEQVLDVVESFDEIWGLYETVFITGTDGSTIATSDGSYMELADREYIQIALNGRTNVSPALVSRASGNVVFVVAAPIYNQSSVVGVAAATVPTDEINSMLRLAYIGETGEAYLVAKFGNEIKAITESRFVEELLNEELIEKRTALELVVDTEGAQAVMAGETGVGEYADYRGAVILGAYTPLQSTGWGVMVEQDEGEAFAAVNRLVRIAIIVMAIGLAVVVLLALLIANTVSSPAKQMSKVAQELALGDINQEVSYQSKDEIGELANAFRSLISYQQDMAQAAEQIADGDLTANIETASEKDVVGAAFVKMIHNLREQIGALAAASNNLGVSSEELATVSGQAGQATSQIAATIQQVARGTGDQNESITKTASSVEQMTQTIEGVARGAQDQAEAANKASTATGVLSSAIHQVSGNVQAVTEEANKAAQAAQNG